jgi:murein L,D-transpeptidase YafK
MIGLLLIGMLAADNPVRAEVKVDQVVVLKGERTLNLLAHGKIIRTYRVALGGVPVGPKERQGDHKTPEGRYVLDRRNPHSQYYKSIHISYPHEKDRRNAETMGVHAGGDIMIHGLPPRQAWVGAAHRDFDWTEGCIAVTNEEIEEIWSAVPVGTPIHIKP